MQEKDFDKLVDKYINGTATLLEKELVEAHLRLLEELNLAEPGKEELALQKEAIWERLQLTRENKKKGTGRVYLMKQLRWVAAAVFVLVIATTWFLVRKESRPVTEMALRADVKAPVTNRAMVTLSNGQTMYLDNVDNGVLATQGSVKLEKLADGRIVYTGNTDEVVYNTLTNPRGSKSIDLTLGDGSHVWLNAGSSITYPVAFAANKERRVEMTGEAYYEIVHRNDRAGFVVTNNHTEVKVLGTHFNVKAYDNEPDMKITLLEGSVRVNRGDQFQLLKPNQQAVLTGNVIQLVDDADTEQAVAWKNGVTSFHSVDLVTILREIERWYNIETVVQGNIPDRSFYAEVSRTAALSEILKVLELNNVKYVYDAGKRKLTVTP